MRSGIIGRKLGMTRIFTEQGEAIPVTVLQVGPCPVVMLKNEAEHGYNAVQLGFEDVKPTRAQKPVKGHFAKANVPVKKVLREFRVDSSQSYEVGQTLTVENYAVDNLVDVTGKTIGKGFAGSVKRWGFRGGRASHGAHRTHRSPGSIGQCQTPGRVYKNKKMAGHMGVDTQTILNLKVASIDVEKNLLVVKGSIPGAKGSVVYVRDSLRSAAQ
ncbi:MAG: 50S ribosomal protein L3 [Magnetococcales bacterium]|nr:50S ribosomal protein L3 [Magnetococcales bacterium]